MRNLTIALLLLAGGARADMTTPNLGLIMPGIGSQAWGTKINNDIAAIDTASVVSVMAFGATGDGTTDDTAAIQRAVNYASSGAAVYFPPPKAMYRIATGPVIVANPMTLFGYGAEVHVSTDTDMFRIVSSSVIVTGLKMTGTGSAYDPGEQAINVVGTSAARPLSNIKIVNNTINDIGFQGIQTRWLTDFIISGNIISNINYAAIMILSSQRGVISNNDVDSVTGTGLTNAYGIAMTVQVVNNFTTDPRSSDIVLTGNSVSNVPLWDCYNTHLGQRIVFSQNSCYNANVAFDIGGANLSTAAPIDIVVSGNVMDSGATDGSRQAGISFTGGLSAVGCSSCAKITGSITGNTIRNFGAAGVGISGEIYMHDTLNVTITGNSFSSGTDNGINLYYNNWGTNIVGNTFIDMSSAAIVVGPDYNMAINVAENVMTTSTGSGYTSILVQADANPSQVFVGPNVLGSGVVFGNPGTRGTLFGYASSTAAVGYAAGTEVFGPFSVETATAGIGAALFGGTAINAEGTDVFDNGNSHVSNGDQIIGIRSVLGRNAGVAFYSGTLSSWETYNDPSNYYRVYDTTAQINVLSIDRSDNIVTSSAAIVGTWLHVISSETVGNLLDTGYLLSGNWVTAIGSMSASNLGLTNASGISLVANSSVTSSGTLYISTAANGSGVIPAITISSATGAVTFGQYVDVDSGTIIYSSTTANTTSNVCVPGSSITFTSNGKRAELRFTGQLFTNTAAVVAFLGPILDGGFFSANVLQPNSYFENNSTTANSYIISQTIFVTSGLSVGSHSICMRLFTTNSLDTASVTGYWKYHEDQ